MDRQELILWGLVIICCLGFVILPIILFIGGLSIAYGFVSLPILFLPLAIFWCFVSGKISSGNRGKTKKIRINLSSVLLGIFCGIIAGFYAISFLLLERISSELDVVSIFTGGNIANGLVGFLSMIDASNVIPTPTFFIFVYLFLVESVWVTIQFLAKKQGLNEAQTKQYLKRNVRVALVIFILSFVLTWVAGTLFVSLV